MKTLKFEVSISVPADEQHRISSYKIQESLAATARFQVRGFNLKESAKIVVTEKTPSR